MVSTESRATRTTSSEPFNLADGLAYQIKRNQKLIEQYQELEGMPNVFVGFAVTRIKAELERAIDAAVSGDVVRMLEAYQMLEGNE